MMAAANVLVSLPRDEDSVRPVEVEESMLDDSKLSLKGLLALSCLHFSSYVCVCI